MNVFVAYSGGTDSTYSLLHYKNMGYNVTALHAQFAPCDDTTLDKVESLRQFCAALDIPFIYQDYTEKFYNAVIAPFCTEYAKGNTPNPCALCNPAMKFGVLLEYALSSGAQLFATGHYARITMVQGVHCIQTALDATKDQSYFLSMITAGVLQHVDFPLGDKKKIAIRAVLRDKGITPPFPSDSQEICFVPNDDHKTFLSRYAVTGTEGDIRLLSTGEIVGKHRGLHHYTEGQRRGLGIAWEEPLYVVKKDRTNNTIYVAPKQETYITTCKALLQRLWVEPIHWGEVVYVKTRYKQHMMRAAVQLDNSILHVSFEQPEEPVAQGQILVVYNADGIIMASGILQS